jgi:hypothetical protein
MEVSGQVHASAALSTGRRPQLPIEWEVRWASDTVRTLREEKNLYPELGFTLI